MNYKPSVLIAGITGMLGYKIANSILDKDIMKVKALVRSSSQKKGEIEKLLARGIILAEGDLLNLPTLLKACEDVDVVVSAVKGGQAEDSERQISLTGQLNLLQAAKVTGVKRFIPSDYSVDYFKLEIGDNYNLDIRKQVADAIKESGINYTFVLNGAFTEILFSPFLNIFDFQNNTFSYWGDGETLFDTTTIDDTAKYIAEVIVDPEMVNKTLKIAGNILTMKQLHAIYEEMTGKKLEIRHLGSIDDLKQWIEKTKQHASSHFEYLAQQYLYVTLHGKAKLDVLDNARYPHIHPMNIKDFIIRI